MIETTSYWHVLVLVVVLAINAAVIWAIVITIRDRKLTAVAKFGWVIDLVLLPVIGLLVWAVVRMARSRSAA